jgi:hypothetical protein
MVYKPEGDSSSSSSTLLRLIQHVFFPSKLPSKGVDLDNHIEDELELLTR